MNAILRRMCWLILAVVLSPARAESPEEAAGSARPPLQDLTILLLRDDAVRDELKLSRQNAAAIDEVLLRHNRLLMAIRDVGPTRADASLQPAVRGLREELKPLLTKSQKQRLFGLTLQAQGYDSLTRDDVVKLLQLTEEQQRELAEAMDEFWIRSRQFNKATPEASADERKAKLDELQAERHRRVLAILDQRQTTKWSSLLGAPFDFSVVRASPASAPEFEEIDEWINSEPLSMNALRGKVVVIHFFAFGCINCVHNYPWYRQWQEDFAGQDVVIVGLHTPETQAETDNESLRRKLAENQLNFAVAVDKKKKNWDAWSNNIWPAVYIVDKRGRLRYWWYGELDWNGAGGQVVAHQRIEELLAEPPPAAAPDSDKPRASAGDE